MSVDTTHADLDQVRADELQHILVRRQAAKLGKAEERLRERLSTTGPGCRNRPDGPRHLRRRAAIGLLLYRIDSGPAPLGLVAVRGLPFDGLRRRLHRRASLVVRVADETPFDRTHFPLREEAGHEQPPIIKRLIYSGHYLFKPWLLFNKWLVGVVLINLAIFSAMLAACTLIALLWRTIDFPWFRERGALLSFGDDLMAPFWPAIFFGVAWLLAWLLSYYRRGTQAAGRAARFFLYLAVPSALIGCGLLVGNGDIAGGKLLETLFGSSTISIKPEVWGPVVALVVVGLLPFLRPRRLLQSGLRPQKSGNARCF